MGRTKHDTEQGRRGDADADGGVADRRRPSGGAVTAGEHRVLALQQTAGNRAVRQLLVQRVPVPAGGNTVIRRELSLASTYGETFGWREDATGLQAEYTALVSAIQRAVALIDADVDENIPRRARPLGHRRRRPQADPVRRAGAAAGRDRQEAHQGRHRGQGHHPRGR